MAEAARHREADEAGEVRVRLFAGLESRTSEGRSELDLEPAAAPTVAALLDGLGLPRGAVGLVLVNGLHATFGSTLAAGDEVAVFPPLGGG